MKIRSKRTAALLAGLALLGPDLLRAADAATDSSFDFFAQEAQVVSASRREQKKSDSPVAIDVITQDDIVASGAQNIWDVLRFRVGMDVEQGTSIEGNPAQVNVRGLPSEFAQNMQVLVDGRSLVSAMNSGVFWNSIPVALADVERIEIVRGPNAALFGANAGQGVINIITKKPVNGSSAVELGARMGQNGYQAEHLAMTLGEGPVRGRVSIDSDKLGSFPTASGDTGANLNAVDNNELLNARIDADVWADGELELFFGHGEQAYAIPPSPLNINSGVSNDTNFMAQLHQKLGADSVDVTVSGRQDTRVFGPANEAEQDYDADALYRLSLWDGKSTSTFGVSLGQELAQSDFVFNYNNPSAGASDKTDRLRRAYAQENLVLSAWATLALAGSWEDSDIGGQWPAYQGALILKPFEDHSLRLSASHSPTTPSLQNVYAQLFLQAGSAFLVGPNGLGIYPYGVVVNQTEPVASTQVSDYEATWSSAFFDRHVTAEITGYQMEVNGLIEFSLATPPVFGVFAPIGNGQYALAGGQPGLSYPYYANQSSVVARGTETVLTFKPRVGTTLQVNHTYEDVQYQNPTYNNQDPFLSYTTPWNKVNLLAQSDLIWGFNAAANVGWVGGHNSYMASRGSLIWIPDQATVDLRLGYKPTKDLEVYAVAQSIGQELQTQTADGTAVPQSYFGGVSYNFGGK